MFLYQTRGSWATSLTWESFLRNEEAWGKRWLYSQVCWKTKSNNQYPLFEKRILVFYLYKFGFPLPKDALFQIWWRLAWWFWRRRHFQVYNFTIISPLRKPLDLCLNNLQMFYAKFGWNLSSRSGEEFENMKCFKTDRKTRDGWQVIRKAHLSFQLKWAKRSIV